MGNYERNPLMADFSVDYFETKDGVRLRYLHKGEGMPFILLHGYSDDADMSSTALTSADTRTAPHFMVRESPGWVRTSTNSLNR